jgi:DNA-binding MarR family transcriptional regulator
MSATKDTEGPRRFEPVSDAVILVALDRAERHEYPNPRSEKGVRWTTLIAHLGFVHDSWTTRRLRPQVQTLIDAGLIVRTQNARRVRWRLTDAGAVAATQVRLDGQVSLPDSPVRRQWRRARSEAAEQIEGIRARLGDELRHALALLDSGGDSDAWYRASDRLSRECRRLGGAVFCLDEWDEPDDEHPDRDRESRANDRVGEAMAALRPHGGRRP